MKHESLQKLLLFLENNTTQTQQSEAKEIIRELLGTLGACDYCFGKGYNLEGRETNICDCDRGLTLRSMINDVVLTAWRGGWHDAGKDIMEIPIQIYDRLDTELDAYLQDMGEEWFKDIFPQRQRGAETPNPQTAEDERTRGREKRNSQDTGSET